VRRLVVFALATVAATAAALAVGTAPAWAHICPIPVQIPVGQPATIAVGVTVENATVTDVTVGLPAGLRLDRVDPKAGWTSTHAGSTVHYRGGTITAFTCQYFSLGVTAATKGAFGIAVEQRTADGTVVAHSNPDPTSPNSQLLDQFVYAGVAPPKRPSTSSGPSVTTIGGIVLLGFGIVMFGVLGFRTLRARKVDARLEAFKKRTPDPPPQE
jgi:uncharacterized protein YcnI